MRIASFNNESELQVLALAYNLQRLFNNTNGISPLGVSLILLAGAYANRKGGNQLALTAPEFLKLLGRSRSNYVRIDAQLQKLASGTEPYFRKEKREGQRAKCYPLTDKGFELLKTILSELAVKRHYLSELAANDISSGSSYSYSPSSFIGKDNVLGDEAPTD